MKPKNQVLLQELFQTMIASEHTQIRQMNIIFIQRLICLGFIIKYKELMQYGFFLYTKLGLTKMMIWLTRQYNCFVLVEDIMSNGQKKYNQQILSQKTKRRKNYAVAMLFPTLDICFNMSRTSQITKALYIGQLCTIYHYFIHMISNHKKIEKEQVSLRI